MIEDALDSPYDPRLLQVPLEIWPIPATLGLLRSWRLPR